MKQKPRTLPLGNSKIPQPSVESAEGKLPRPVSGWTSLLLCVRSHKANVLATAIESNGIFVYDRFNRRILATDGLNSDPYSINYALDLIESVAEEERNPGPIPSWDHERWELEDHPLERFGWPAESLPDFVAIKNSDNGNLAVTVSWTQRTKLEFEKEKIKVGSFQAAGKLHGVSRSRYTQIYNRVTGTTKQKPKKTAATGGPDWGQLVAHKK